MPDLPRITQRLKRPDVIIEILCLITLLESWTYAVYTYNHLPNWVTIFYTSSSPTINERSEIWIFPILATLIFIMISWICSFPHKLRYSETITSINARRVYRKKQRKLRLLKLILVLICGTGLLLFVNLVN